MPHSQIELILNARHPDPFAFLGPHGRDKITLRVFLPQASKVTALQEGQEIPLKAQHSAGFFSGYLNSRASYLLGVEYENGFREIIDDPYRFPPYLGELDLHLIKEGRHQRLFDKLGAQKVTLEGVEGINFALWAPNASHVSLVGDFNFWDGRKYPLRFHPDAGVWEIFIPNLKPGALYKYEIKDKAGNLLPLKADPFAFAAELAPNTASIVHAGLDFAWEDQDWLERRGESSAIHAPISIYEVHLGSWRKKGDNERLNYIELAHQLADYVKDLGFTHIELLPIHEYPFDGSWGYQPLGLFAPTQRYGSPEDFAYFVNHMHKNGIGVIIDWVAGHFPADAYGLASFDGTCLYEHEDPRQGRHKDWDTLIYNYGRNEVVNFLISNALFWLERFHIDGLRADAVASMLYLDYSRKEGEWIPNKHGGRENLEAVAFLRQLNEAIYAQHPGVLTIAEESTAWPLVSRPTYMGGLGFGYKWNMGWMHDTLDYLSRPPIYRQYHQNELTFGILYAFSENFVLPLSHDEVVHGKGSLVRKMPGDAWQRFANLRLCYALMFTMPGKKLLFMGGEFAQEKEWNHDVSLDWHLLGDQFHNGIQTLVRDLNRLYRKQAPLHQKDCEPEGFQWVDCHDAAQSVISFLRKDANGRALLIVGNFTPVVREAYRLGVPYPGQWREIFNSDAPAYGGSGVGNWAKEAENISAHGFDQSLQLILPPLGMLVLVRE